MTTGTAIFLSVLVAASVALYWLTRDRVRWGKILIFLAVGLVGMAAAVYVALLPQFWRGPVNELEGVQLGETEKDVLFKNGNFDRRCTFKKDGRDAKYFEFKKSSTTDAALHVTLLDDRVALIWYVNGNYSVNWDRRNSISFYDDVDDIRQKFGVEDFYLEGANNFRRYIYRDYNTAVALQSNKVQAVGVFDPRFYYLNNGPSASSDNKIKCVDKNGAELTER